mgnify:CR=1 FL=1
MRASQFIVEGPQENANVVEMFKKSSSIEEFEKLINTEESNVNNLDLNEDGEIDYINVESIKEGDTHVLILSSYLNEKEEDLVLAKLNYSKAIKLILKEELEFVLNRERRDLAYELGRVTADFEINDELGITSLQFYYF